MTNVTAIGGRPSPSRVCRICSRNGSRRPDWRRERAAGCRAADASDHPTLPLAHRRGFHRPVPGGVLSRTRVWIGWILVALVCACRSAVPGNPPLGTHSAALGIGASADDLRTGWYGNQPSLSPTQVSGPSFGQLFDVALDGSIYAQPLVFPGGLLVATENNHVYVLDPVTGAALADRALEPPWRAADIGCGDLVPNVGITGTPVIDPATSTAYLTTKTYAVGHLRTRGALVPCARSADAGRATGLSGRHPGRSRQRDRGLLRSHPPAPAHRAPPADRRRVRRLREPLRHHPIQGVDRRGQHLGTDRGPVVGRGSLQRRRGHLAGGRGADERRPEHLHRLHRKRRGSTGPHPGQHAPQRPRTGLGPPHRPAEPHARRHRLLHAHGRSSPERRGRRLRLRCSGRSARRHGDAERSAPGRRRGEAGLRLPPESGQSRRISAGAGRFGSRRAEDWPGRRRVVACGRVARWRRMGLPPHCLPRNLGQWLHRTAERLQPRDRWSWPPDPGPGGQRRR